MKNNSKTTFIIVAGIIVLVVFATVLSINLLPNYESNSYFVKVGDEMSAKIEAVNIENGKLIITTSGDPIEYCVKSTRTTPTDNALCWKKVENNTASVSVFKYKKYYVWIKDEVGNISNYLTINSNGEKNNQ